MRKTLLVVLLVTAANAFALPGEPVDRGGRLFFAESHLPDPALAPAASDTGSTQTALVPVDQTFFLHSRPSATKKIYLDFTGHTTTGTSWVALNGSSTFYTRWGDLFAWSCLALCIALSLRAILRR